MGALKQLLMQFQNKIAHLGSFDSLLVKKTYWDKEKKLGPSTQISSK